MRMWMVDTRIMCRNHLLGEHVEIHMFNSVLGKGHKVDGYLMNNLLEISSLKTRHDALVLEMKERGYNHNSPFNIQARGFPAYMIRTKINGKMSLDNLLNRCPKCKARHDGLI